MDSEYRKGCSDCWRRCACEAERQRVARARARVGCEQAPQDFLGTTAAAESAVDDDARGVVAGAQAAPHERDRR